MSQELKNNPSEEIDLIQLFGFFESKIKSAFKLLFNILKSIYEIIIAFLQILQQHALKIGIFVICSGILGYIFEGYKTKIYSSTMMVKPMFDSKYQLFTNIGHYNALIANQDINKMSSVFNITKDEAASLTEFIMKPGPENENEKILAYDHFIKSVDSSTAKMIEYDKFIEQMSIYNGTIYEITVTSTKRDIFLKLYPGFVKTFETPFSIESKKKKDSIFQINRTSLLKQLSDVETLQKMYTKELSKEQNSKITSISGTPVIVGEEQKNTREFEAFQLSLKLRDQLNKLEEKAIKEDRLFEIVSDLPSVGTVKDGFSTQMKLIFPILAFILSLLFIFGIKFNNYIKNYNLNS